MTTEMTSQMNTILFKIRLKYDDKETPILPISPAITMTTISDGDMRDQRNREIVLSKIGVPAATLVRIGSDHAGNAKVVDQHDMGTLVTADAIFTTNKILHLGLTTADCIPMPVFDRVTGVFGIIHAGWKELSKGVIKNSVELLQEKFNSKPRDLRVVMGPAISVRNYEVGDEIADLFKKPLGAIHKRGLRSYLDLKKVAISHFNEMGVDGITQDVDKCTYDIQNNLYSHRRDFHNGIEDQGRFMTLVGFLDKKKS